MPHIRNNGKSWTLTAETDHSKIEVSRLCREELEELFRDLVDAGFTTAEIERLQAENADLKEELDQALAKHEADLRYTRKVTDDIQAQIAAAIKQGAA